MVKIRDYLDEDNLVTVANVEAYSFQNAVHITIDHGSPILGPTNEMMQQQRNIVALSNVLAHTTYDTTLPSFQSSKVTEQAPGA